MAGAARIAVADGAADTAQIAAFERDRRDLLRRGLGLGGAVVAASSIPLLLMVRDAFAATETDATLLSTAITIERVSVLAYDTILGGSLLSGRTEALVRLLRGHERRHADTLTTALTDLGGEPPPAPAGVKAVDAVVKGLGTLGTKADVLAFAIALETAAVAAYYDAQAKFIEPRLLQTAASIMASEGQHLVLLREAAGRLPVPNAVETGNQ